MGAPTLTINKAHNVIPDYVAQAKDLREAAANAPDSYIRDALLRAAEAFDEMAQILGHRQQ
jgi:hypothetical protein